MISKHARITGCAILVLLCSAVAFGQTGTPPLGDAVVERLGTDRFSLQELRLPASAGAPFEVVLELDGQPAALALNPHSVRAGSFRVLVNGPGGATREVEPAPLSTYRGAAYQVDGNPLGAGLVAASLHPDGLTALLLMDDGRQWMIEPARTFHPDTAAALHVIYDAGHVRSALGGCAANGLALPTELDSGEPPESAAGTGLKLCQIALEADTHYYTWKGSSVPATQAAAETLINSVALIYENDVGITYQITTLVIQAKPTNQERYGSNKHDKLLNQFVAYWRNNYAGIPRDTAHLLTGRTIQNLVGGFAFIGVVCNKNSAFGFSWANAPISVAQRVGITAHELGHNFNAQHCNGDGDCAVMCATIGACGPVDRFGNRSRGKIVGWRNNANCLSNVPPTIELPFTELFHQFKSKIWSNRNGVGHTAKAVGEPSGSKAVNLDKAADQLRSYKIDLSAATNPVLSFMFQHRGAEAGEELIVEYLNLVSVWTELLRITSDGETWNSFRYAEAALPGGALWNSCRIRFTTTGDQGNDDWFIDDVHIESTTPTSAPTLCASDTPPIVAAFVLGGGAPANQQIQVMNCGDPGTNLPWTATETPPVGWVGLSPTSGTVLAAEPFDNIDVSFNPAGLTAGIHTTLVKLQQTGNPSQYIEVPVTLVVHAGMLFVPGDLLQGQIMPVGDTDLAAFCGLAGQKLKLSVSVSAGDLKPVITAVDKDGVPFKTLTFKNKSKPQKGTIKLNQSGLFGLLVGGKPGTSGTYSIQTGLKNPPVAKLFVGNRKPPTGGGTVELNVGALPGTLLSLTIVPKKDGNGPFTASLTNPDSNVLFTNLFARSLMTGGTQILQIPLGSAGLYTVSVSGFAAREKVTATLDPQLPQSAGATINLD